MIGVGYVSSFGGVLLVDGNTKYAGTLIGQTSTVRDESVVLNNGMIFDTSAGANWAVIPGTFTQRIVCTSGYAALYNSLSALAGTSGSITFTTSSGSSSTKTARLVGLADVSPTPATPPDAGYMELTFRLLENF